MNKKILQFMILFITVLLVLLVPALIEGGYIPIKNKILAYTIIFAFMIMVSLIVSYVMKKYEAINNGAPSKRSLYDSLSKDHTGNRISYNLARAGVDRSNIAITEEKNSINIKIEKGIYTINLLATTRTAELSIKYDNEAFNKLDDEIKDKVSKAILEASIEPKRLVMKPKDEVYQRIINLYKQL